jgi:hypothetical protein
MSTRHKPDYEMEVMRRGLRDLQTLPPDGRKRALTYWNSRVETLPEAVEVDHGEQQTDIEDYIPTMPHLRGAAA